MATATTPDVIPLIPRRRLLGTATGGSTSIRRGGRSDVATSRPYRPGDHVRTIDWKASARMSSARDGDEFVVRERHADEMPAVVLVADRRPSMALYPADLPWLRKAEALREVGRVLVASALNQRSLVGYLDCGSHDGEGEPGDPYWRAPRAEATVWGTGVAESVQACLAQPFDAPEGSLDAALDFLATRHTAVPVGSFVFVVSDFLAPPADETWVHALSRGWDVVPVIVQDPVWEQSFPDIAGVLVSVADAGGAHDRRVRLGTADVAARRAANEQRLAGLRDDFMRLGLDPVLVGSADPAEAHEALLDWAQARLELSRGVR